MTGNGEISERKNSLRKLMAALCAQRSAEDFIRDGEAATRKVLALGEWRQARTVCAFLSMRAEISSDDLGRAALAAGKGLYLPRVEGDHLVFLASASMDGPWDSGPFGIREPQADAPAADFAALPGPVIVIVPGLAFDRSGGRLGRGKGYYDRFLGSLSSIRSDLRTVGICSAFQLVDSVPMAAHDLKVDMVAVG